MTVSYEQKKVYDGIYEKIDNYNFYDNTKNKYVDAFAKNIKGRILDAGCGEGIHLKRLLLNGCDVFGVEISEVCYDKFLKDLPCENTDILSYTKKHIKYDGVICMDVLEHIDPSEVEETVSQLSKSAPQAMFGIANHSDVLNGVELHLIREDRSWWVNLLLKYYSRCFVVNSFSYCSEDKIFFMIYCDNNQERNGHSLLSDENKKTCIYEYYSSVSHDLIDSFYKDLNKCKDEATIQEDKIINMKLMLNDMSKNCYELKNENNELKNENNEFKNENNEFKNENNEFKNENNEFKNENNELKNENNELKNENNELKNENNELKNENNELKNENIALNKEFIALYNEYNVLKNTKSVRLARYFKRILRMN